ncbi:MAG: BMP family protein [Clostridia bacterium]|nr:BMP family protein [Clostridia bacterium]
MKKNLFIMLIVLVTVAFLAVGCGQNAPTSEPNGEPQEKAIKVALLLSGPINDMGWNASAYEGLMGTEEKFGVETSYVESVSPSDMEEYFRGYAIQGYDIIFGHGFQFGEAAKSVAPDFPDVKFIVVSSNISEPPNLGSANLANRQQGFLMGVVAGLMTETNVVGGIGGAEIPPISLSIQGFKEGVEYVNPDARVLTTLTGTNEDVSKAKETALAMIDQGADIVMGNANQAGLGVIEAARERGVLAIASNQDQNPIAPDTVLVSAIKSVPRLMSFIVETYIAGNLEPKFYELGIKEGAVFLSSWHGFENKVPQEVKDRIDEIIEEITSGKLKISDYQ